VNEAVKAIEGPVDQVRVVMCDEDNPLDLSTTVSTDTTINTETYMSSTITVVYIYVQVITSFTQVTKTTTIDGFASTEVTLSNNFTTTKTIIDQVAVNPGIVNFDDVVPEAAAASLIVSAINQPAVIKKTVDVCGEPTHCPPDNSNWSRIQMLACQQLHSKYFQDKRRTELNMNKDRICDLQGTYKQKSFHGYCKASGPHNYLGLKDEVVEVKPDWQVSVFLYRTTRIICVCMHLLTILSLLYACRSYANPLFALMELMSRRIAHVPIM